MSLERVSLVLILNLIWRWLRDLPDYNFSVGLRHVSSLPTFLPFFRLSLHSRNVSFRCAHGLELMQPHLSVLNCCLFPFTEILAKVIGQKRKKEKLQMEKGDVKLRHLAVAVSGLILGVVIHPDLFLIHCKNLVLCFCVCAATFPSTICLTYSSISLLVCINVNITLSFLTHTLFLKSRLAVPLALLFLLRSPLAYGAFASV